MNPARKAFKLVALLASIFFAGIVGYSVIEGWSIFDALYMTVITLATVGYGETHPLSTAGRIFTIFLITGGLGIILYSFTEITAFIIEGEMTGYLRRRTMNKAIQKLRRHSIVCGVGNNGRYVVEELVRTKRPVVVVEQDKSKVLEFTERGIPVVEGDAASDDVLRAAGIEHASGLVASLPEDKDNLFVVITARGLNPKLRIVAKIDDVEVREKLLRSGADTAVSASYIGGLRMASELVRPKTVTFLDSMLRGDSSLRVEDVEVDESSDGVGKPLRAIDAIKTSNTLVVALKHGDAYQFNPSLDSLVHKGDTLIVIGDADQVEYLRTKLGH